VLVSEVGWRKLGAVAQAVVAAEPAQIEATAVRLGSSRWILAPIAWAAGSLVLLVKGIGLLVRNWRLTLLEVVPALWVWLAMWDLRRHDLRAAPMRDITPSHVVLGLVIAILATVAAFWFNVVFGFAIEGGDPRDIKGARRRARSHLPRIVTTAGVVGVLLAVGLAVVPRLDSTLAYLAGMLALYSFLLLCLVMVPARILGVRKPRLAIRQKIGYWCAGGALSAVVMTPGFLLDRLGIFLLGVPGLHLIGFLVLTVGTALYAAGMSSVKAVKLSMKLDTERASADGRDAPSAR
jgi:hypothetical protein